MFDIYIHFQGNCAEAMTFYAEVFGGRLQVMRYRDMPEAPPELAESDLVMHSVLTAGGRILMAGDFPPGMPGDAQKAFSVSHIAGSLDQARVIFDRLAEGGNVIMGFGPTFWSDGYGMLRDRFGTHWMVAGPERSQS